MASACCHSIGRRDGVSAAARSSMDWFRSVDVIETCSGSVASNARVSTPVPAAHLQHAGHDGGNTPRKIRRIGGKEKGTKKRS
jgi:hypothetical protein